MIGCVSLDGCARHGALEWKGTLGYWIDHAYWGRGYATEAASALLASQFLRACRVRASIALGLACGGGEAVLAHRLEA